MVITFSRGLQKILFHHFRLVNNFINNLLLGFGQLNLSVDWILEVSSQVSNKWFIFSSSFFTEKTFSAYIYPNLS